MVIERRWGALRTVAAILKGIAWLTLVIGGTALLVMISAGGRNAVLGPSDMGLRASLAGGLATLALGVLYFLLFYVLAEGIQVIVAIEENTRIAAKYIMERPVCGSEASSPGTTSFTPTPGPPS